MGAVDLVVHAASQTSPQHFTTDPVGTIDGNVLGTRNLLQWSHDHGVGQFLCSGRQGRGKAQAGAPHIRLKEREA